MRTVLVRTVLTASAVSLALLATACGGKADGTADAKASASAPATSAAPAAKGKTDAELAPLLIAQADAPDYIEVKDAAKKTAEASAVSAAGTTDKPECKVLLNAIGQQKIGAPTGVASTALGAKPKELGPDATDADKAAAITDAIGVTTTLVGLSSYEGKGAEETVASVKAAGQSCAGGFAVTEDGESTRFESVKPGESAAVGDEAVSLVVAMDLGDGEKSSVLLTVARKGNTVATFSSISLTGKAVFPKALIEAQGKKLV